MRIQLKHTKRAGRTLSVVALAVLVAALAVAATIVISNELHQPTTVVEHGMTIEWLECMSANYEGPERPTYGTMAMLGIEYDALIKETAVATVSSITLRIDVGKAAISPADVTLQLWDGSSWITMTPIDNGDELSFGMALPNMSATQTHDNPLQVTFNTVGAYTLDAYVTTEA